MAPARARRCRHANGWRVNRPIRIRAGAIGDLEAVARSFHALWPEESAAEHRAEAEAILRGEVKENESVLVNSEGEKLVFAQKTPPAAAT